MEPSACSNRDKNNADNQCRRKNRCHDRIRDQNTAGAGQNRNESKYDQGNDNAKIIVDSGYSIHQSTDSLHNRDQVDQHGYDCCKGRKIFYMSGTKTLAEKFRYGKRLASSQKSAKKYRAEKITCRCHCSAKEKTVKAALIINGGIPQKHTGTGIGGNQRAGNQNCRRPPACHIIVLHILYLSANKDSDDHIYDHRNAHAYKIYIHVK